MKIDRILANNSQNLPFAYWAVGFDEVERIEKDGEAFVGYDEAGTELFRLINFYTCSVTYVKENVTNDDDYILEETVYDLEVQ